MKKLFWIFVFLILAVPLYSTTWYVRPAGGSYGAEDGTSYAAAWDGLLNVVWGVGGVVAGDTLYVCGLHVHDMTSSAYNATQADITISVSGTSGNEITIRGDYGGDAGIIWGAFKQSYESWVDEGSNVWSIAWMGNNAENDWYFEDVTAGSWTLLDVEASEAACAANAGSVFPDQAGESKIFVHCGDSGDPTGRIYMPCWGYQFKMNGRSYIKFLNLKFYVADSRMFPNSVNNDVATHLTWEGCTIWYRAFMDPEINSTNWTFDTCDIAWCKAGVGLKENTTVKDCTLHDIGVRASTQTADAHGIGANIADNCLVEGNEIYNVGSGLTLYLHPGRAVSNFIVRNNYIHDTHTTGGANSRGIELNQGANTETKSNVQVYGNIVTGCGSQGYSSTFQDPGELVFYNNVAYDCDMSFYFNHTATATGPNIKMRNNISLSPGTLHVYMGSNANDGNYVIDSDNNCFYPDGAAFFRLKDSGGQTNTNFAGWQGFSQTGCIFDPSGVLADPAFVNAGGSYALDTDFQIPTGSPCKDAGINVGLDYCYFGVQIPSGDEPDIGVHEYDQGVNPHKAILKEGTKLILGPGLKVVIK